MNAIRVLSNIFAITICVSSFGCKHDEEEQIFPDDPITKVDTTLIIGDSTSGSFTTFQPIFEVVAPWHSGENKNIDLNGDGIDDLNVVGFSNISPGGLNARGSYIKTLNPDIQVLTFTKIDSTIRWSTTYPGGTATFNQNYDPNSTYPTGAVIITTSHTYIQRLNYDDIVTSSTTKWDTGSIVLSNIDNSSFMGGSTNVSLGPWLDSGIAFMAFKINNGNASQLGWIKMNVSSANAIRFYTMDIKDLTN